jgi:hypothetical protein
MGEGLTKRLLATIALVALFYIAGLVPLSTVRAGEMELLVPAVKMAQAREIIHGGKLEVV